MTSRLPNRARLGRALVLAVLLAAAAPLAAATAAKTAATPVDLNTATVEGLTAVPGIGKVMAARIVQWREEHGPFRRVEDLMKVKGVGEKMLEKLRPHVRVGESR